jgi:hypothetical protein
VIRRRDAETQRFESGRAWREVSKAFRNANPVCQVIENGVRCIQKPAAVHHLIAPEVRPDLRIAWENLVSVCARHHGPEAGDVGRFDYVPTRLPDNTLYVHLRRYSSADVLLPTGDGGKQFISGGPSSADVDRFLASLKSP